LASKEAPRVCLRENRVQKEKSNNKTRRGRRRGRNVAKKDPLSFY